VLHHIDNDDKTKVLMLKTFVVLTWCDTMKYFTIPKLSSCSCDVTPCRQDKGFEFENIRCVDVVSTWCGLNLGKVGHCVSPYFSKFFMLDSHYLTRGYSWKLKKSR